MAMTVLQDWQQAWATSEVASNSCEHAAAAHQGSGWKMSCEGTLKVNIDAGWTGVTDQGLGMVIRDHNGECAFAATRVLQGRTDLWRKL